MSAFVMVELAAARTGRLMDEAGWTVVTAENPRGWALLRCRVRPVAGDDRVIRIRLHDPHPPGSQSARWWRSLVDGGTVGEYVRRRMARGDSRAAALRDMSFWLRRDWITLTTYVLDIASS